jgi:hypothetical protein
VEALKFVIHLVGDLHQPFELQLEKAGVRLAWLLNEALK